MGEGLMSWITNGASQSLSTGFSWSNYFLGPQSTLGSMLGYVKPVADLWSAINGVRMVQEGWKTGNKTKMAIGTLTTIVSSISLMPESWKKSIDQSLFGGFGEVIFHLGSLMMQSGGHAKNFAVVTSGLVGGMGIAFGAELKELVGDTASWDDEGVAALFAVLTTAANIVEANPTNPQGNLAKLLPQLEQTLPAVALLKDREQIYQFVIKRYNDVQPYLSSIAGKALELAGVGVAKPVGQQIVINAPRTGKKKSGKRGKHWRKKKR